MRDSASHAMQGRRKGAQRQRVDAERRRRHLRGERRLRQPWAGRRSSAELLAGNSSFVDNDAPVRRSAGAASAASK